MKVDHVPTRPAADPGPSTVVPAAAPAPWLADPSAVDTFEGQRTPAHAQEPKKQGFFSRIFSAIGNFFASIFRFFTGGSKTSGTPQEERSDDRTNRLRPGATDPTDALRPGQTYRSSVYASQSAKHVIEKLVEAGYSRAAAAGIAANIFHESGFNSAAFGDSGSAYGICQWRFDRLENLRAFTGSQRPDLDQQIAFMLHEMETKYPAMVAQLKNTNDPAAAAELFERVYERPAKHDPGRMATARDYHRDFNRFA